MHNGAIKLVVKEKISTYEELVTLKEFLIGGQKEILSVYFAMLFSVLLSLHKNIGNQIIPLPLIMSNEPRKVARSLVINKLCFESSFLFPPFSFR